MAGISPGLRQTLVSDQIADNVNPLTYTGETWKDRIGLYSNKGFDTLLGGTEPGAGIYLATRTVQITDLPKGIEGFIFDIIRPWVNICCQNITGGAEILNVKVFINDEEIQSESESVASLFYSIFEMMKYNNPNDSNFNLVNGGNLQIGDVIGIKAWGNNANAFRFKQWLFFTTPVKMTIDAITLTPNQQLNEFITDPGGIFDFGYTWGWNTWNFDVFHAQHNSGFRWAAFEMGSLSGGTELWLVDDYVHGDTDAVAPHIDIPTFLGLINYSYVK